MATVLGKTHRRNRPMMKINKGDCNQIARDRSGKRSGAPTPEYCRGYDVINWRSKQRGERA